MIRDLPIFCAGLHLGVVLALLEWGLNSLLRFTGLGVAFSWRQTLLEK